MTQKPKILVIVGPTASGKSALAVTLAKRCNGEIISADSRQVYKGLNIATGKVTKKEMRGVPHYMLNVADPKRTFTVAEFQKKAGVALKNIVKKNKLPIIVGGTGFYVSALVDGLTLPHVSPNKKLRVRLEKCSAAGLYEELKNLDPDRAAHVDPRNKRRLIRAVEIARALGRVPHTTKNNPYNALWIGLAPTDMRQRISRRLKARIKQGMIAEAEQLHGQGLSLKRMRELGLEYRCLADLLAGTLPRGDFERKLETAIWHYAKRQMTWFKKDKRTYWFHPEEKSGIIINVKEFLRK